MVSEGKTKMLCHCFLTVFSIPQISYLLVCLPAALTAGITLGSVFTEYVPLHRCFIDGCDDQEAARYDDAALMGFDNFTEPSNFQCQRYQRLNNKSSCSASDFDQTTIEECGRYLFEDTVVKSSIVSEYGLVCDKDWQVSSDLLTTFWLRKEIKESLCLSVSKC